jgi:hypothetical protein
MQFDLFLVISSGKRPIEPPEQAELTTANFLLPTSANVSIDFKTISLTMISFSNQNHNRQLNNNHHRYRLDLINKSLIIILL